MIQPKSFMDYTMKVYIVDKLDFYKQKNSLFCALQIILDFYISCI
jgi:hypothetical protein